MKTIIYISIAIFGAFAVVVSGKNDDHRSCSCSGTFCGCSATCLDMDELPNCICGVFTCICKCDPKDAMHPDDIPVPTMSADQEANSIKGEGYFRGLGNPSGQTIANSLKALREAIKAADGRKYSSVANTIESTFASLPNAQIEAWEAWSTTNLKK